MISTLLPAFTLIGSGLGLLIALSILLPRRQQPAFGLGLLLLCASVALGLITMEHHAWVPQHWMIYALEESLTVLSGALLLNFVYQALGRNPHWIIWAPPIAFIGFQIAVSAGAPGIFQIEHVIWIQMGYFAVSTAVFFRSLKYRKFRWRKSDRTAAIVLVCMFAIHVAQIIRMVFNESAWAIDIVPLTGTLFFYVLLLQALAHSPLLRTLNTPVDVEREGNAAKTFQRIQRLIESDQLWSNPDLGISDVSEQLSLRSVEVSEAINLSAGKTFPQLIAQYRVQHACQLLGDPDEARYSVEGIGLQCGFGSRAAFYRVFKQHTGLTPASWRTEHVNQTNTSQNAT